MALEVVKFGGSSLRSLEDMKAAAGRIAAFKNGGSDVVVVVSAMQGSTDRLLDLAGRFKSGSHSREVDQLLSTGEQQSVALLAMSLEREGFEAVSLSGPQAGLCAGGRYGDGRITRVDPKPVSRILKQGWIPIVAGFQAGNGNGDVITLGRGGSDLSAVAIAAALEADRCSVLKDVPAVYSADPGIVPEARKVDRISYKECMEMAAAGAKVIQARSVELAARYGVVVYVAGSFSEEKGTWIMREDVCESLVVRSIASDRNVAKVAVLGVPDVPGVAAGLFGRLSAGGVGAEMIIQSVMRGQVNDIAFLVKKEFLGEAIDICRDIVREIGAQGVAFDTEIGKVTVIGAGIANHPEVPSRMFSNLAAGDINIDMISSTSMSITCVVAAGDVDRAVTSLHGEFIGDDAS
ncbi:MAG: aspartate kinase [Thermovirgaceae bacterium]